MTDLTPIDAMTRCDICKKPFIYGMVKEGNGVYEITERHPDPGGQQADGRWTHNRCYEEETK